MSLAETDVFTIVTPAQTKLGMTAPVLVLPLTIPTRVMMAMLAQRMNIAVMAVAVMALR
jgi:hypothetical protein